MQVTGVDLKRVLFVPSHLQEAPPIQNQRDFKQMLIEMRTNQQPVPGSQSAGEDKKTMKSLADLLAFLKTADYLQLNGGKALQDQLSADPQADPLLLAKDFLGISEQKWSEVLQGLGLDSPQLSMDSNGLKQALMKLLTGISKTALNDGLNENTKLFIKAAKLVDLLGAFQGTADKQMNTLSPLLDSIKERLQVLSQNSKLIQCSQYPSGAAGLSQNEPVLPKANRVIKKNEPVDSNLPLAADALQTLLVFLQTNDLQQLNGAKALLSQHKQEPNADILPSIQDYLGISHSKWTAIIHDVSSAVSLKLHADQGAAQTDILTPEKSNEEGFTQILTGLTKLDPDQLQSALTENTQLFIKAAKLYDLLKPSNSRPKDQPDHLLKLLDTVTDKLPGIIQESQNNRTQPDFSNPFSKIIGAVNQEADVPKAKQTMSENPAWDGQTVNFQPMSKPEQLSIMLSGSQKNSSTSEIIQQFESILAKSHFTQTDGVQKLLIKLSPENLGSLRIELIQKDHTIVAKILASTQTAKDILESQVNGLKTAFAAQNIQVDRVEIGMQSSQTPQEQFSNHNQQNQQEQNPEQQRQQTEQHDDESNRGFTLSLEEALFNTKA